VDAALGRQLQELQAFDAVYQQVGFCDPFWHALPLWVLLPAPWG
jgi:hypothetical protein